MGRKLDRFVTYAAAAAALASLMPLAARHSWVFDLATHFRVQYVAVDALLALACVLQRKPIWCLALAGCAAFSARPLLPYLAFAPDAVAAAPASGQTIKLLSANVLFENPSAAELLQIVRDESPDVVLLVEYPFDWSAQVEELRAAYPYHLEDPATNPFGMALFSRFALDSIAPFALGDTEAVEAHVRTPAGRLTVIGVHLRSPTALPRAAMRNRQLNELAAHVLEVAGPVAVIGDFNVTPYSPFFQDWLARTGLTDTRRGRTLSPSWPTMLPVIAIPIDHCAVSRDIVIVRHRGLPAFGSDHYPILAELALSPLATPAPVAPSPEDRGAIRE